MKFTLSKIPDFNPPVQLPKSGRTEKEIDYSVEYEVIIKTNRKIGRSFIQLIHNYRYDKVNPANLEVNQLFYPKKLYNYLRNHHWKDGIPEEFAIDWFKNSQKDFSDEEELLMEFQVILNQLNLPYSVQNIEIKSATEPQKKRSSPGKNYNKQKIPLTRTVKPQTIPSINNFTEFQKWLLNNLDLLENLEINKTRRETD